MQFLNFLSLSRLFPKATVADPVEESRRKITQRVDALIDEKNVPILEQFITRGYPLQAYQCANMMERFAKDWGGANKTLRQAILDSHPQEVVKFLLKSWKLANKRRASHLSDRYNLESEIMPICDQYADIRKVLYCFPGAFEGEGDVYKKLIIMCQEHFPRFNRKIDSSHVQEQHLCSRARSHLTELKSWLEENYHIFNGRAVEEELGNIAVAFNFSQLKTIMVNDISTQVKAFKEEDLCEQAKQELHEISNAVLEISQLNIQDPQKRFEIDNLYHKRLPQVLEEYITMTPRYREFLFGDDKKTAQTLLIESLQEIKLKLQEMVHGANEEKLMDLKTTRRYLGST